MSRRLTNREIANRFDEIALYLRAQDVAFKPQAFEVAAEGIRSLSEELVDLYKRCGKKCVDDIPGIGKSLADKIIEAITTGHMKEDNELKKKFPFDMLGITQIPDVGPKTALLLYKHLHVKTLTQLERAAKTGKIAGLPHLGTSSQRNILRGIQFLKGGQGRRIIHEALPYARLIVDSLKKIHGITHLDIAGSLRRRKETIGDIDLIATTSKPADLAHAFVRLPQIERVIEQGPTKIAVRYKNGMAGDLLILPPDEYGAALVHFTGSREHNILLRERAKRRGLKLSEHGLFKAEKRITNRTEKQVYASLGLQEIPPEMRVGSDEVDRAAQKKIPSLIAYGALKGDLQVQTNWSDGDASIEQMAQVAKAIGLSYLAVTDHTQSLTIAHGLDEKRLLAQGKEIDKINKKLKGFRILKSTECDIKKDGSLDLKDEALKTLDLVCVSIHSNRAMKKNEMTQRIIHALKHPLVNIFFHPTGRIVNVRDGYEVDMDLIIKVAKQYGVALEVNGSQRLDLHEGYVRQALEAGVKLVVNSDAHSPEQFANLEYGLAQARRGWAKKVDVLNTKTVTEFLRSLSS
ncbi:DNA polymerase/3'-5' exonuclease PolX [Candidatus Uhrbacteria bacterium]|nr:DNA polymerase/3'-5' exonuclease PolX [Candidatus Uhrbacteria bacterium]